MRLDACMYRVCMFAVGLVEVMSRKMNRKIKSDRLF